MHSSRIQRWSLVVALAFVTGAQGTPTENLGLRVLPAPTRVVIDGKANDWDLSGGIFTCDDVEHQREQFAVWLHAMYDAENLYLLAHFKDATPLNNPGQTVADYGFAGDSLQVRTLTAPGTPQERGQHFTCWKGRDGADVIKIEQGKDFKEGVVEDAKKSVGAQQAFTVDADGKGYVQEIALPWKLLTRDGEALRAERFAWPAQGPFRTADGPQAPSVEAVVNMRGTRRALESGFEQPLSFVSRFVSRTTEIEAKLVQMSPSPTRTQDRESVEVQMVPCKCLSINMISSQVP